MKSICIVLFFVMISHNLAQKVPDQRQREERGSNGEILNELKEISKTVGLLLDKHDALEGQLESMADDMDTMKDQISWIKDQISWIVGSLPEDENSEKPCSCSDLMKRGITENGVYEIFINNKAISVYCDMETDGGGWLVFQRRTDGSENFYRNWNDYKNGFGSLSNEFWLGNENLYQILNTCGNENELRVDLGDFRNERRFAKYSTFNIESVEDNYRLRVDGYSGNAGDSLHGHRDEQFSTFDKDNDPVPLSNCAEEFEGAWWYYKCHDSNLNGQYLGGSVLNAGNGVIWYHWRGNKYSLKFTEMKFRPKL